MKTRLPLEDDDKIETASAPMIDGSCTCGIWIYTAWRVRKLPVSNLMGEKTKK